MWFYMDNRERVLQIIVDKTGVAREDLRDEAKFCDELGCDSLDLIEIVIGIEHEFGISIKDEEYDKIETVGELLELVKAHDKG